LTVANLSQNTKITVLRALAESCAARLIEICPPTPHLEFDLEELRIAPNATLDALEELDAVMYRIAIETADITTDGQQDPKLLELARAAARVLA
jgi:hypothetical protein